jgi:DNA invertase Pin-like site-specific DNA recombinase
MRRVALYVRVSTADQTTENQERELTAIAARMGWEVVSIYRDEGISGSKGRDKRPALNAMLKDVTRRKFDMVMAWSVDRLGRSLQDLVGFLSDLHAARVDLFLHLQGLDTTTPSGRAMFQMLGVFAEFERAILVDRTMAGLARARAQGKRLGRPATSDDTISRARELRANGMSMDRIARELGIGKSVAQRVCQGGVLSLLESRLDFPQPTLEGTSLSIRNIVLSICGEERCL